MDNNQNDKNNPNHTIEEATKPKQPSFLNFIKKLDSDKPVLFVIGFVAGMASLTVGINLVSVHLNQIISYALVFLFSILTIVAITFFFKERIFAWITGLTKATLLELKDTVQPIIDNLTKKKEERDWDVINKSAKFISEKVIAAYSWSSYKRTVLTVINMLFVGFIGIFSPFLIYNQNQLLEKQNAKIDSQIHLEESSRRGNLIVMMSNIMDKVDDELTKDTTKNKQRALSPQLISRIIALSYSLRPYKFLKEGTSELKDSTFSPERGQLLLALLNSELDSTTYVKINERKATFEKAYLQSAFLKEANLYKVNLPKANLAEAILSDANLNEANLQGANFQDAQLLRTQLTNTVFVNANLKDADLSNAILRFTKFNNADLTNADLSNCDLRRDPEKEAISFENTVLKDIKLENAKVNYFEWSSLFSSSLSNLEYLKENYQIDTLEHRDTIGIYYLIKPL